MQPREAAERAKETVSPPWDELRAARVQRRVLDELRAPGKRPPSRRGWRRLLWLAAAACLLSIFMAWLVIGRAPVTTARLELADGSYAVLEPSARVVPELVSDTRIELRQLAGVASYDVTSKPSRLFVVHIDDARVEVLGTAFQVEKDDDTIRVSVSRGHVRVLRGGRTVELKAGEQVTLSREPLASAEVSAAFTPATPVSPTAIDPAPPVASTPVSASDLPAPPPSLAASDHAAELFRRADAARAAGDQVEALRLLREVVQAKPGDGRALLASFTIGRIENQRGNHGAAAAAFEACGAAMSGEALAEAALARAAAGQAAQAKQLAARYRTLFPSGPRSAEMEKLGG